MKSTRANALTAAVVAILALACGVALASGAASGPLTVAERVIPSKRCRGLWLVDVVYRDGSQGRLSMVLDTGAGRSAVDPQSIERVFDRRFKPGKRVTLKDGKAGPLELRRLKVEVHEMDHLSRALGREIDGILGFPAFKSLLLTFDYHHDEVRVAEGRLAEPDGKSVFRDVGRVRPYLAIDLGQSTEPVLVDSGSAGGFRLDPDDDLRFSVEPRPISANTGYDEIRLNHAGRAADDIRVGPLVARTPVVRIWDGTRLIGAEVMHRFVWTFDQRTRRIRMITDSAEPILTGPVRGIGVAFKPVAAGFEVNAVFPGTPGSRVDLAPGDVVVAVDGVPVDDRDCDSGFTPEGVDSVVLTVRRNGSDRDIAVDVVELVP